MITFSSMIKCGTDYSNQGKVEEAIDAYKRAVKALPDDFRGHYGLAHTLDKFGQDPHQAEISYNQAITLNPFDETLHAKLICFHIDRGEYSQASFAWERAVDLLRDPDLGYNWSMYNTLHASCALHLLHAQQLDFARIVLLAVPVEFIRVDDRFKTLLGAYRKLHFVVNSKEMGLSMPYTFDVSQLPSTEFSTVRYDK